MACLLQIFISVLAMGILSEAKHEVKNYTHKIELMYTATSYEPKTISLNCSDTAMQGAPVYWEKQGKEPARLCQGTSSSILEQAEQLRRPIRGPPDAGIFTCCSGTTHEPLSRHTVLVKKTLDGEIVDPMLLSFEESTFLTCTANSYSGNFACSWKVPRNDPNLQFTIIIENGDNTSGRIICDEPMRNSIEESSEKYTVSCRKENSCPSAEEYQPITIILEVVNWSVYVSEEHSHTFFIKEIIKPDALECQIAKHGNRARLTWAPPETWTKPDSYFPLTYQIKIYQHGKVRSICEVDDTTLLRNGSTLTCYLRGDMFHIRSRDYYNESDDAWSSWSELCGGDPWRNDKLRRHNQEGKTKVGPCKCQN